MHDYEFARLRSQEAAAAALEEATREASAIGLRLQAIDDDGGRREQRWLLRDDETNELLLVFWPATAKAQEPGRCPFRCRGWRHALRLLDGMMKRGRFH